MNIFYLSQIWWRVTRRKPWGDILPVSVLFSYLTLLFRVSYSTNNILTLGGYWQGDLVPGIGDRFYDFGFCVLQYVTQRPRNNVVNPNLCFATLSEQSSTNINFETVDWSIEHNHSHNCQFCVKIIFGQ